MEVSRFACGDCKYFGSKCKCIDQSIIHFARSCFSCDTYTAHHLPCSMFDCVEHYPALRKEWEELGFWKWHALYIEQWHNNKVPINIGIIRDKPMSEGREIFDDVWEVPYQDFLECNIIRPDGIHYVNYRHIERTRKTPTGYQWINEGAGVLPLEELYE